MEIFKTARLRLTTVVADDEAMLRLLYRDADVMRFYPNERKLDLAPFFVARSLSLYDSHGFGLWNVRLLEDDTFAGQCGFVPAHVEGSQHYEAMIFLHRRFWRYGYAEEILRATLSYGLQELAMSQVIALIFRENRPSSLLARRSGFSFVRTVSMLEGPMDLYECNEQPTGLYKTNSALQSATPATIPSSGASSTVRLGS